MSNKYLEKVADLRQYGRMAREAVNAGRRNPMTTAFGAGGALDGALSTTRQGDEGNFRLGLRGVRNTIVGAAKGAAAGKALELGYKHLKHVSENSSPGFLSKSAGISQALAHLRRTWGEVPLSSKASLGVSISGLGISAANYKTNKESRDRAALQAELDRKALAALRGIHRELKAKPVV